jgi:hypothetical protein
LTSQERTNCGKQAFQYEKTENGTQMHRRQRDNRFSENPTGKKGFASLFILDDLTATFQ